MRLYLTVRFSEMLTDTGESAGIETKSSVCLLNNTACMNVSLIYLQILLASKSCGDSYVFVTILEPGPKS